MSDGYQLIATGKLDIVLRAFKSGEFLLAICHWIIQQLYVELNVQLAGVKIEVIKIEYIGAYPGLAIRYENPTERTNLGPLVEATIDRLLEERPLDEFITFLGASSTDWLALDTRIMTEGN